MRPDDLPHYELRNLYIQNIWLNGNHIKVDHDQWRLGPGDGSENLKRVARRKPVLFDLNVSGNPKSRHDVPAQTARISFPYFISFYPELLNHRNKMRTRPGSLPTKDTLDVEVGGQFPMIFHLKGRVSNVGRDSVVDFDVADWCPRCP